MTSSRGAMGDVLAGLCGALVFLLFLIVVDAGIVLSVACGAGGFVAGLFLFRRRRPVEVQVGSPDEDELREAVKEGQAKLAELRAGARSIQDPAVGAKVEAIAAVVARVLDQIRQDPRTLKNARQFLNYYLEATIKIVARYATLSSQHLRDADIQASLRRVEGMLETIRAAFEKQLALLLSNDVMDLDTELGLLEKTIKMEGLTEDIK
jgi:5-bromo-4-chloroindolyl phosphate hydrolysis protein